MSELTQNYKAEKKGSLGIIIEGEVADVTKPIYEGSLLSYDANGKIVPGVGVLFAGVADTQFIPACAGEEPKSKIRFTSVGGQAWIKVAVTGNVPGTAIASYVADSGTLALTGSAATLAGRVVKADAEDGYAYLVL